MSQEKINQILKQLKQNRELIEEKQNEIEELKNDNLRLEKELIKYV